MHSERDVMTPLAKSQNLAARMGRWSAAHRKIAIFGWLAFVAVAVVLGSMIGTKNLDPADAEAGDSGRAAQIIDRGGFGETVDESVFIESESLQASSPEFEAVVAEVEAKLAAAAGVSAIRRRSTTRPWSPRTAAPSSSSTSSPTRAPRPPSTASSRSSRTSPRSRPPTRASPWTPSALQAVRSR